MADDAYRTLELDRQATAAEIRQAYFRLAHKYHPDHNLDDPDSVARFKEVQQAYEKLTALDDARRAGLSEKPRRARPRSDAPTAWRRWASMAAFAAVVLIGALLVRRWTDGDQSTAMANMPTAPPDAQIAGTRSADLPLPATSPRESEPPRSEASQPRLPGDENQPPSVEVANGASGEPASLQERPRTPARQSGPPAVDSAIGVGGIGPPQLDDLFLMDHVDPGTFQPLPVVPPAIRPARFDQAGPYVLPEAGNVAELPASIELKPELTPPAPRSWNHGKGRDRTFAAPATDLASIKIDVPSVEPPADMDLSAVLKRKNLQADPILAWTPEASPAASPPPVTLPTRMPTDRPSGVNWAGGISTLGGPPRVELDDGLILESRSPLEPVRVELPSFTSPRESIGLSLTAPGKSETAEVDISRWLPSDSLPRSRTEYTPMSRWPTSAALWPRLSPRQSSCLRRSTTSASRRAFRRPRCAVVRPHSPSRQTTFNSEWLPVSIRPQNHDAPLGQIDR